MARRIFFHLLLGVNFGWFVFLENYTSFELPDPLLECRNVAGEILTQSTCPVAQDKVLKVWPYLLI